MVPRELEDSSLVGVLDLEQMVQSHMDAVLPAVSKFPVSTVLVLLCALGRVLEEKFKYLLHLREVSLLHTFKNNSIIQPFFCALLSIKLGDPYRLGLSFLIIRV